MKPIKLFVGVSVIAAVLSSCMPKENTYRKPYVDFDSLITAQLNTITNGEVVLLKKTRLNSYEDSTAVKPDSLQLKNELQAFRLMDDINKPVHKGMYEVKTEEDANSNLLVRTYTTHQPTSIIFVKLFFKHDIKELKRIESSWIEKNVMIHTRRDLMLEFDDHNGVPRLVHYAVAGEQKVVLSKPVSTTIEGWLKYPA
ncbi:MAG: hypothetical protein JST43_10940 [Bacteroidetes bacterium]|nr:hypothetical protein [Bacteroidota bacterium]MBS1540101.1 hypothetical protein [Bacteroidota bacterium]